MTSETMVFLLYAQRVNAYILKSMTCKDRSRTVRCTARFGAMVEVPEQRP